ncbi:MAG TPA: BTAD domain-containing putative transcriptional regulator [Natronosporangium sp.]
MRVGILGPLAVTGDEGPVAIGGSRLRTLLIRLALEVGRPVRVPALAEALWGDDQPGDQANAVQTLVSRLRRLLPAAGVIASAPGGYRLDLPADAVDANRFEQLAAEGRRLLHAGDPTAAAAVLAEALALWRGPALADVVGAEFAVAPATRLEELRLAATEDRLEAELASGGGPRLVAELEQLAAAQPLRERPQALLLRARYQAGQPAAALAGYEQYRTRLADELGMDPSPALQELHRAVLRGQLPGPVHSGPRGNLRAALTSFVGRAGERRLIGERLAASRLVTLVGPGGAGKTRLATAVAADFAARLPGGVWLVELAAVTDPADVAPAVLGALRQLEVRFTDGRRHAGPADPVGRIVELLSAAPALLVLDNCEHLVEAAARLAEELLGRCPQLRILTTSREPLALIGEALCPVPPLALPDPAASVAQARETAAVRLFEDRASAARPGFTVDEDNVAAVVEVCRRLDGLPLAIELAAARLRSLSPTQLAARLDDRFRLLSGGSRTALPRHRTLRAVVDWSWQLLADDERVLARRLAVFPAGITPAAAEAVCADDRLPGKAIADLLIALADKSLLQVVDDDEPRYRMLDTIREFAQEQLAEAGESADVLAAHSRYFLALAETAEPHLRRSEQLTWLARLGAERANLLTALHTACDQGDADRAVRLASAMSMYFMLLGQHAEAANWLRQALAVPGESAPVAHAYAKAAYLINSGLWGRRTAEQRALAREVLAEVARLESVAQRHPLLAMIAPMVSMFTDDTERARANLHHALSTVEEPWTVGMLHVLHSFILENDGDPAGRRAELAAAVAIFRELGERWGLGTALTGLAEVQGQLGDFDAALAALAESVALMDEVGSAEDAFEVKVRMAVVRARLLGVEPARAELLALLESEAARRAPVHAGFARLVLADLSRHDGDLPAATELYQRARAELGQAGPAQITAVIDTGLAQIALAQGDLAGAEARLTQALAVGQDSLDITVIARVAIGIAELWLRRGEPERAAETLGAAEALRGGPDRLSVDLQRVAAATEAALGETAYRAAYARGRAHDRPRALAALDLVESGPAAVGPHRERGEQGQDPDRPQ